MAGLTKNTDVNVTPREIDFVSRFSNSWEHLIQILGIVRPVEKRPGQILKSKRASVVLEDGNVGEGETIPFSKATVQEVTYKELTLQKYRKGVTAEAISDKGYDVAVQMTDDEFLAELQQAVTDEHYRYLLTGQLRVTAKGFQQAIAKAMGSVTAKWRDMHKTITGVVGFVNVNDMYSYLGEQSIGAQVSNDFGWRYLKNWMGFNTIFLCSDSEVPRGMVVATPVENIVLYYLNPANSDLADAGFEFVVDGETPLLGFKTTADYSTYVSVNNALMGLTLFSEYLDGIAVVYMQNPDMTDATVGATDQTAYWGTNVSDMQTNLAVSGGKITGTLKKITTGALATDWGEGYFMALKFSNFSSGLTYSDVEVGLVPSEGAGFVALDSDQDGVFKVTDKDNQVFAVRQTDGDAVRVQYFDLSDLVLE